MQLVIVFISRHFFYVYKADFICLLFKLHVEQ